MKRERNRVPIIQAVILSPFAPLRVDSAKDLQFGISRHGRFFVVLENRTPQNDILGPLRALVQFQQILRGINDDDF